MTSAAARLLPPLMGAVAVVVLAADQATKWWAENRLADPIEVVWTLRLALHYNTGAAFSLFTTLGPLLGILAVGIVIVLVRMGRTLVDRVALVALGLVLGGAVGNLVDRVVRTNGRGFLQGRVVDWIDLQWWPVFNIADMGIVIGGALLVLRGFRAGPAAAGEEAGEGSEEPAVAPAGRAAAGAEPVPATDE